MKLSLLIIMGWVVGLGANAQKIVNRSLPSSAFRESPIVFSTLYVTDSGRVNEIMFKYDDSTFVIRGDTTKVLWMMQKYLRLYSDKYNAAAAVLNQLNLQALTKDINRKEFTKSVNDYKKLEKQW